MRLPVKVMKNSQIIGMSALLDCGATHCFISPKTVIKHRWMTLSLKKPMTIKNADGSLNKNGSITKYLVIPFKVAGKHML